MNDDTTKEQDKDEVEERFNKLLKRKSKIDIV